MNANYLALIVMVAVPLAQFFIYVYIRGKERGTEQVRIDEITQLRSDSTRQRLMIENIATYLEAKNGIIFRRD
jgi:hypothetical protein